MSLTYSIFQAHFCLLCGMIVYSFSYHRKISIYYIYEKNRFRNLKMAAVLNT